MKLKLLLAGALASMALAPMANAATVTWTDWSNTFTTGATAGSATGTMGSLTVTYTGELQNLFANYPTWTPTSSYIGGDVSNGPPQAGGIPQLFGGPNSGTDTITFSSAVVNPVIAIWSLGQGGINAMFDFTTPVTYEAGGPSAEYNGQPIVVSGDIVSGLEGNGVIELKGTFKSITFTTPVFENWYGFTVGSLGAVPEPASWALMLTGLGLVGGAMRAQRKRAVATVA